MRQARVEPDVVPRLGKPIRTALDELSGPVIEGPPDNLAFTGEIIGNVPNAPTACDRQGVLDASTR